MFRTGCSQIVIAVPARDEAEWIARCLTALAQQQETADYRIVVLVNNSIDATSLIVRELQSGIMAPIEIVEHQFPLEHQTAGQARRLAMEHAAARALPGGTLLCTDADGQVAPDWLAANLFHIRNGADAVAGRAIIDATDAAAIPALLHENDARECAYAALLDEIDSLADPDAADPWPRHTEHSGASIAVTLDAFRKAGGIPPYAVGEDRAFFAALRRIDARIRHAEDVQVTVSGRIHGCAHGGMADTIRRRLIAPDLFLDDALEPAANRARRARLRCRVRQLFASRGQAKAQLAVELGCTPASLSQALAQDTFGRAWELIEKDATRLAKIVVPVSALHRETVRAEQIIAKLRRREAEGMTLRLDPVFVGSVKSPSGTSHMAG